MKKRNIVTPCVGVWIETGETVKGRVAKPRHTLRGCVDWNGHGDNMFHSRTVTPCVGVWIETNSFSWWSRTNGSHTLRGCVDWNGHLPLGVLFLDVTPCVGVWIETARAWNYRYRLEVTPCVGVWIETFNREFNNTLFWSHPAWVCGLKHRIASKRGGRFRHTLRGCIWIEALFTRWSSLWKNCKHSASCVFLFKLL